MTNDDYQELLQATRRQAAELGLHAIDERILSNMRGSDGPFWDLMFYLTHLQEEIRLGSDAHYRETLGRIRQYATTESEEPVAGIRIEFSDEESARYGVRYLDFAASREFSPLADELQILIRELREDHDRNNETGGER